jgi:hypothetical protein
VQEVHEFPVGEHVVGFARLEELRDRHKSGR